MKPSPLRMYCSLMALNSSCPAVSSTVGGGKKGVRMYGGIGVEEGNMGKGVRIVWGIRGMRC